MRRKPGTDTRFPAQFAGNSLSVGMGLRPAKFHEKLPLRRWCPPGTDETAMDFRRLLPEIRGQAQDVIEARTGVKIGQAQLAGLAGDLAAWADDFYAERARDADTCLPWSDVIMMQADGKGIAMRPEHRASVGKESDAAHPGI